MNGKWIKLIGEKGHVCDLPWSVDEPSMGATYLQKRHTGSIWECECGLRYEWKGKKFDGPM
jgi:hypothetical protein